MDTDANLVTRARQGDDGAFGQLVSRHYSSAHRAACAMLGSAIDAEDVVQDAWLHAYVHLPRFEEAAMFTTWVYAIVRNRAIDHHRRARRRRWYDRSDMDVLAELRSEAPTPEELALDAEKRHRLSSAIAALPDRLRVAMELWRAQYSYEEMARIAGVSRGTMKSRLWLARRRVIRTVSAHVSVGPV